MILNDVGWKQTQKKSSLKWDLDLGFTNLICTQMDFDGGVNISFFVEDSEQINKITRLKLQCKLKQTCFWLVLLVVQSPYAHGQTSGIPSSENVSSWYLKSFFSLNLIGIFKKQSSDSGQHSHKFLCRWSKHLDGANPHRVFTWMICVAPLHTTVARTCKFLKSDLMIELN